MSSVMVTSSFNQRSRASRANAFAASPARALPNEMTILHASAFLMNSHTPSEQTSNTSSEAKRQRLNPGTCTTPTLCAIKSPKARDIARPGISWPRAKTRWGMPLNIRTTSPPEPTIRRRSSGSWGLWSTVPITLSGPFGPMRPTAHLESPHHASKARELFRSTTATVNVVPLSDRSKPSMSAWYMIAWCVVSKILAIATSSGKASAVASSARRRRSAALTAQ
mmetsp:Transcript_5969/g.17251  ORF Transcript_5969/g.17251 Transcript_5969/m.17251 type:complete len:223 (+) Transcript_5969:215-883(+)